MKKLKGAWSINQFPALTLDFEHLVFVSWIKPGEMLSRHIVQSAWRGHVFPSGLFSPWSLVYIKQIMSFSSLKHPLPSQIPYHVLQGGMWCGSCLLLSLHFQPFLHFLILVSLLYLKHAKMLSFHFFLFLFSSETSSFASAYNSLLFIIQNSAEILPPQRNYYPIWNSSPVVRCCHFAFHFLYFCYSSL